MDHIIPLKREVDDLFDDWYRTHVLLAHRLGLRIDGDGNTRWLYSIDARDENSQVILLRTLDAEADRAAMDFAPHSEPTHKADIGQRIDFALTISGRQNRPGTEQSLRERHALRTEGIKLNASKCLGNYSAHVDYVSSQLDRAGLSALEIDDLRDRRFIVRKGRGHRTTGIGIVGIMVRGSATVADVSKLDAAICSGLGRDKAFGFGTLSIAAATDARIAA